MWIVLQIIGALFVFLAQASNRYYGFTIPGVLIYSAIAILLLSWILPLSYQLAPSFFQPYFMGLVLLSIFGLIGSCIIFGETITLINFIGIVIIFIGSVLINL